MGAASSIDLLQSQELRTRYEELAGQGLNDDEICRRLVGTLRGGEKNAGAGEGASEAEGADATDTNDGPGGGLGTTESKSSGGGSADGDAIDLEAKAQAEATAEVEAILSRGSPRCSKNRPRKRFIGNITKQKQGT